MTLTIPHAPRMQLVNRANSKTKSYITSFNAFLIFRPQTLSSWSDWYLQIHTFIEYL